MHYGQPDSSEVNSYLQYITKVVVSAILIVLISEISKRSSLIGAVLASVPVVSVLAMIWLYAETRDVTQVAALSRSIVWLVIPSLALFVALPMLLSRGFGFYFSLSISVIATVAAYFAMITGARFVGVHL
jgi:hypothetical protein